MKKNGRQKIPQEVVDAESSALREIWERTPADTRGNQAEFGEANDVGNQSAVGQFQRGQTPISTKAAIGFATGLGCRIADFSPRLAKEAEQLSGLVNLPDGPAAELVRRIETASPETVKLIELALLSETDLEKTRLSPSLKGLIGFVKHQIREETKG